MTSIQEMKFRNIRMSAQKVRTAAKELCGLKLNWAVKFLLLHSQKRLRILYKALINVSNALDKKKVEPNRASLKSIRIDGGSSHKTLLTRAKGRADFLSHPKCHITITTEIN
ncbi:50S ribosomal subunit protein L22 [Candidatus Tremblaya phenacola PAVE]|nr:50S ribosomal subunit protein L22 [Candidatus Tremblaya phenacola PAVE]